MTELEKLLTLATVGSCGVVLLGYWGWQRQRRPVEVIASREFALRLDPHLLPMQPWPLHSAN